ncbi:LPD7 domain-containing protein [Escherichia coli]|uniref:LPD7 domain-containing protein n=2 Tax=Escherichia coli TaxID=562 RepID=UPI001CD005A0|nr:LPD7 domain-containing protein [Escherichia coli]HBN3454765.1 DNA primase [Escherichia coli]HBN3464318.1 DNA primase [Escherichia coli]HBN3488269.1 DNA primase [Escherichia coli]HBN4328501.1 DNA primase [Escherichia coli]
MKSRYRTWLAVPPEETEAVKNAVPPLNGRKAVAWDPEKKLWYARAGTELSLLERWLPRPQELSMDAGDPVTEFAQVLENAGLVIQGLPQMDGAIHRVATRDDKKGAKSGAYKAYLDGRPAGWYRDYRSADDSPTNWVFSGGEQHDPLARLHLRAFAQQQRDDNARKLQQQYNKQARYARSYINGLPQATAHEYLTRKGIRAAPGVRLNNKNELVIPFSNGRGEIRSYQRIPVTGGKDARILKDSEKTGNWFTFGTPENGRPLLFAEGYATAASLHEATGLPVLMTVDAGNMIAVAENARQIWTDSPFVFCADNDHQREINKGVFSATKAAEVTNGEVIIPAFTEEEKAQGLTDFNDLDASRGRDDFQHVMNAQLKHIGIPTPNSDTADHREAVVIGNLIFTPVKDEKPQMSPENKQSTAPETVLATPDTPYDIHTEETENQAYEDDYAAYASLQSVTTETLSPDKPLENIASAAETGAEHSSDITDDNRNAPAEELNADATVAATVHNTGTAETASPSEPAETQPVRQATAEPTAEDKPQEERLVSATETSTANEAARPETPSLFSRLRRFLTGGKSRTSEPSVIQEKKPTEAETATEEVAPPSPPENSPEDTSSAEPDTIIFAPRRPDSPQRHNLDEIIKNLEHEEFPDRTALYRVDGEPAFLDRLYCLEMVDGASADDKKVLAALAVATNFYGGVIELTGSDAFKQKAMQLIVEYDIKVRMKLPAQRAALEKLRKEKEMVHDAIVTHRPTPELNRQSPEETTMAQPEPPVSPKAEAEQTAGCTAETPHPEAPVTAKAEAPRADRPEQPAAPSSAPEKAPVSAQPQQPDTPEEEPPGKLSPGESVTAVLTNYGEKEYAPGKGRCFFVELTNRSGKREYWGKGLEELVKNHQKGDPVTLTLQARERSPSSPGKPEWVRNIWAMTPVSNGITVDNDHPHAGQHILEFPMKTFSQVMSQMQQHWPQIMQEVRSPKNPPNNLYIGEDRQPASEPQDQSMRLPLAGKAPDELIPAVASADKDNRQLNLLLVHSADDHLQGVVRLNGTLYPALATPSADNRQLVINALTDNGLQFAGYGEAVNHDENNHQRPSPQIMQFHLKQQDSPLFAAIHKPEEQPDKLFRSLGFEQTWKEWSDSQKAEDRQEKTLQQAQSHSPGR